MSVTYEQARQSLNQVMAGPSFHQPVSTVPWWYRVLQWLGRHLSFPVGQGVWHGMAWLVSILLIGALCVGVVVYGVRTYRHGGGRSRKIARQAAAAPDRCLTEASNAVAIGDMAAAVHWLIEHCLIYAEGCGWLSRSPWLTLRRSVQVVDANGDPGFASMYRMLAEDAEMTLFAGKQLNAAQAQAWITRIANETLGAVS